MAKSSSLTRFKLRSPFFIPLSAISLLILLVAVALAEKPAPVFKPAILGYFRSPVSVSSYGSRMVVYALCVIEALLIVVLLRARVKRPLAEPPGNLSNRPPNESQELLACLVDSAMDAIIVVDSNRQIILFNAAAVRVFGCAASEAIGHPVERFIPQRFRIAYRTHIPNFAERGETNSTTGPVGALWGLRANGEEFPIEASITEVESQGTRLTTLTIRDITDHLRAEQ